MQRDFAVGNGAGAGAYGGVAAAALAGLVGILYHTKGVDESGMKSSPNSSPFLFKFRPLFIPISVRT
jgi:hypothetical protein